jgi:hypothetical protein
VPPDTVVGIAAFFLLAVLGLYFNCWGNGVARDGKSRQHEKPDALCLQASYSLVSLSSSLA